MELDLRSFDGSCNLSIFDKVTGIDRSEFNNVPGIEHYQLLAHISTLYNNVDIFDIGTHKGSSALALSYNQSNTVYTFDLIDHHLDKSSTGPKSRPNIVFTLGNILDPSYRKDNWEDKLLKSPFIFLDIDPHEGSLELIFIKYLEESNYKGFVICDDIWYFKGMRDNFWYQIPTRNKKDLTPLGHWSGTGIVYFPSASSISTIILPTSPTSPTYPTSPTSPTSLFQQTQSEEKSWTLVTAYYDLTKMVDASKSIKGRPLNHYFDTANSTLALDQNLIVFCEEDTVELVMKIRPKHLHEKTKIIVRNFEDFPMTKYRGQIIQNRIDHPYSFDDRNTASYYLFCMSRYAMLKEVINDNPFNSTHFSWINICIERMGFKNLIYLDEALAQYRDKFSTCYIDYVPNSLIQNVQEYYRFGRCSMCSGFFTGNKEYMYSVCDKIEKKFLYFLELGFGHADEQIFSPVYFDNPELFDFYLGDYQQMITNYTLIRDAPQNPVFNVIRNSFAHSDYDICTKCCLIYWNSYSKKSFQINNETFALFAKIFITSAQRVGLQNVIVDVISECVKRGIQIGPT